MRDLLDTAVGKLVVIVFVGITLFTAGVLATTEPSKVPFIVAIGVVGSLAASVIAFLVNYLVVGDTAGRVTRAADALDIGIEHLASATDLLAQTHATGVRAVKAKADYDATEWRALLTGAHERFFVVGHALDKWCRQDIRDSFILTLRRLACERKDVWLVTLPLDGRSHEDPRRGVSYAHRITITLQVLAQIYTDLPADRRQYLQVRTLRENVPMPYMVAGNDRVMITSAYPSTEQQSGSMLALTIDAQAEAGRRIFDDVTGIVHGLTDPVDLSRVGRGGPSRR